jgi:glucose-6-phosphate dehydrogenase assembly protein OpcA
MDAVDGRPTEALVQAEAGNASAALLSGWIASRLGIEARVEDSAGPGVTSAEIVADGGYRICLSRPDGRLATLTRGNEPERQLPLPRRQLGDLLAEELRRMDPDYVYAEALAAATGVRGLERHTATRSHVWRDPAWAAGASE